jgi:hypothetical protein
MSKLDVVKPCVGLKLVRTTTTYKNGAESLCLTFLGSDGEKRQLSIQAERGSDLFIRVRNVESGEPRCCDWAENDGMKVHQPDCPTNPMRPPRSK